MKVAIVIPTQCMQCRHKGIWHFKGDFTILRYNSYLNIALHCVITFKVISFQLLCACVWYNSVFIHMNVWFKSLSYVRLYMCASLHDSECIIQMCPDKSGHISVCVCIIEASAAAGGNTIPRVSWLPTPQHTHSHTNKAVWFAPTAPEQTHWDRPSPPIRHALGVWIQGWRGNINTHLHQQAAFSEECH